MAIMMMMIISRHRGRWGKKPKKNERWKSEEETKRKRKRNVIDLENEAVIRKGKKTRWESV